VSKNKGFRFAYEIRETADAGEAEILIYSRIVQEKWRGDDPEITAKDFDKLLKSAKNSGAESLRLRINCPGGSVGQAVAMKTMVQNAGFETVYVDIEGLCASAATFFVCIPGAHVRISQGSEFMIHNPAGCCFGGARDFTRMAERLSKMESDQHQMYAARTGKTPEQIKAWMDAETWFTAKEAVENGFADELTGSVDAAACASADAWALMQELYGAIPEGIRNRSPEGADEKVRNGTAQVASAPGAEYQNTHEEGKEKMEIKDATVEQIQAENAALHNAILQQGIQAERTRIQEIDAMTQEGFEELAKEAKEKGTSAADFLKQVVAEQTKRKQAFLAQRRKETVPAQAVTAGSSEDHDAGKSEEDEIKAFAKEMAALAQEVRADMGEGMY